MTSYLDSRRLFDLSSSVFNADVCMFFDRHTPDESDAAFNFIKVGVGELVDVRNVLLLDDSSHDIFDLLKDLYQLISDYFAI